MGESMFFMLIVGLVVMLLLFCLRARFRAWVRRHKIMIAIALLSVFLVLVAFIYSSDLLEIDRCLDRGGRWNSETEVCEERRDDIHGPEEP